MTTSTNTVAVTLTPAQLALQEARNAMAAQRQALIEARKARKAEQEALAEARATRKTEREAKRTAAAAERIAKLEMKLAKLRSGKVPGPVTVITGDAAQAFLPVEA